MTKYWVISMRNKTLAVIQARMSSTRLPGKVLKELAGQPMLYHIVQRVKSIKSVDGIIIATSQNESDNPIVRFAGDQGIPYFRGSEDDVLDRFFQAAQAFGTKSNDIIVRLTADNPFVDPTVCKNLLSFFHKNSFDYATTSAYPLGVGAEVFRFYALEEAHEKAVKPYEREHVTPFMYRPGQLYGKLESPIDYINVRLTVDTPEDYEVAQAIYGALFYEKQEFGLPEIIEYLKAHPDVAVINNGVHQKILGE